MSQFFANYLNILETNVFNKRNIPEIQRQKFCFSLLITQRREFFFLKKCELSAKYIDK